MSPSFLDKLNTVFLFTFDLIRTKLKGTSIVAVKRLHTTIFFFALSSSILMGQNSLIFESTGDIETNIYHNLISSYDGGYFLLFSTEDSTTDLVVSKYDNCHDHQWTKQYSAGLDLNVYDALVHNDQLVILVVTHFNSSLTRTPILISVNMDGIVQFSNQYNVDRFDNYVNLSLHNNNYHLFGPAADDLDGGGHLSINEYGDVIFGNVLLNNESNSGSDFGSTVLHNGTTIRRNRDALIACDPNSNILWAKRFKDYNGLALNEVDPLVLEDGFFHVLHQNQKLVLFKMNFLGDVIWSKELNGRTTYTAYGYHDDVIGFIWQHPIGDNANRLAYAKINQSNGEFLETSFLEFEEGTNLGWPMHHIRSNGELIISGSRSQEESQNQDFIIINPNLSDCISLVEIAEAVDIDLELEEVINVYQTVDVDVMQAERTLTVSDKAAFLSPTCTIVDEIEIDTSLDCNNIYAFNGIEEGGSYVWSDGSTDSIRIFNEPQTISVKVKSCGTEKELFLSIEESECDCNIFVPNIINEKALDPENQKLTIFSNCPIGSSLMSIYDRWGNLVFQSDNINDSWSPKESDNLSQGVYTWVFTWRLNTNEAERLEYGTITYLK